MHLYDFLAPAYDTVFESIYWPFRARALAILPDLKDATVLDLACGTGQNFPFLAGRMGRPGKIIGVDISLGMLRRAQRRAESNEGLKVTLVTKDAVAASSLTQLPPVDFVICTYGFTAMRGWAAAFEASWSLLKPGGGYLVHDIDGQRRNLHTWAVEFATRCRFSDRVWEPLQGRSRDFQMDYLDPSAHLFGGRLFVAYGTKPR